MTFSLPFDDEPQPPSPGEFHDRIEPGALEGFSVLVVEDDPAGGRMLGALLAAEGAVVRLCSNGEDALRIAPGFQPRLAVIDLALPGMSGLILLHALRQQPGCAELIGIAVSALNGPRIEQLADQSGFAAFVRKPINLDELLRLAADLLGARS
jgi:CheY-like chemotaxis protein